MQKGIRDMYIIRLDDASEHMDVVRWHRMEGLLDKYGVKPLVGIIPENHDPKFVDAYARDEGFWAKAREWDMKKGWTLALHGWLHVYTTKCAGINPAGAKSEFAGVSFKKQCEMIREGVSILKSRGIVPAVFFAPSHTYDMNTIEALRKESDIRIISDTVANDIYLKWGFRFVPVQLSSPRKAPFKLTTICLHPNMMANRQFEVLDEFLSRLGSECLSLKGMELPVRRFGVLDFFASLIWRVNRLKNTILSKAFGWVQ